MTYPLADLLRLRNLRRDRAEGEARAAEQALAQAVLEKERLAGDLAEYRIWRRAEMERRYRALLGQTVAQKELDAFHAGLAALEREELRREEALSQAGAAEERARQNVREARLHLARADQALQKILAHRDQWQEADAKERARLEDLEMEEFIGLRPGPDR